VSKKVFMLCNKKKAECIGNNHDAERIKRCIVYAVRQNCLSDAAQLSKSIKTAVEHHFGDQHDECGTWCRVKPLVGDERTSHQLKYRNKEVKGGKQFYDDVKLIVDEFADNSADMLHGWSTDMVEGMNKFFTKFLPKDRTYGLTIENRVKIYLEICIDSVG
jgi:hypothetical protein